MQKLPIIMTIAALSFGIAGVGAAQMHDHMPMDSAAKAKMMEDMESAPGDSASTKAYKQVHMKMMHDMMVKPSGNPDADFANGMIPHHQGAIDMAKIQLEYGKDLEIRKLAEKIISDQEKEIAQMTEWLKKQNK